MMNMLTLTKFASTYTPLKFRDCNVRISSLKTYVNGNMKREQYDFPDNVFYDQKGMDKLKFKLCLSLSLHFFYSELETLISRMSFSDYTISGTKEGKILQKLNKKAFATKRWISGGLGKTNEGKMETNISTYFLEFMKNDQHIYYAPVNVKTIHQNYIQIDYHVHSPQIAKNKT